MDSLIYTPREDTQNYMNGAVAKASASRKRQLILGIMAGTFIAMGAQASNVAVHNIADVGTARTLAGCIFPVGLMMIVFVGGELFTGDCMLSMAWMDRRISIRTVAAILAVVYLGNFLGAAMTAGLVSLSGQLQYSGGGLGAYTIKVAAGKVGLPFATALVSGVLCNVLVCTAVLMAAAAKDTAGKVLAIFFPILAFVVSGFEHCVANMYYIPAGIFAALNDTYVQKAEELYGISTAQLEALSWKNFVFANLLPVTLGNIIGGSLLVGGVCYYIYGRK